MATQVFLHSTAATTHRGTNSANLAGGTPGWIPFATGTVRGAGITTPTATPTVTGPTSGVEMRFDTSGTVKGEWLTPPVDADVTISGAITGNIWAAENDMNANVAINFVVDKVSAVDGTITQIVKSARTTECAVTTRAVNNFTATPGAGVALNKGDRLRIRIFGDDSTANMGLAFNFNVSFAGTTAAADGDTYISFTETFGFLTTDPTGSKLYMSTTASDVGTASTVDREAWTTAGVSDPNTALVTNTATGWTAPIQMTDTAGGTVAEWFTRQLQAFTLGGLAKLQIRAFQSSAFKASIRVEVARVDTDGTNATVWASGDLEAITTFTQVGALDVSVGNYNCWIAGDDLAISDGQRLRIRFFVDDSGDVALQTGGTVTMRYSGADATSTWLQLTQTVAEFSAAKAFPFRRKNPGEAVRDFEPWSVTGWL